MQRNNAAKPCKVLGVWEDEAVHIRGSYCLLSIPLSGTLLSRDFSLSTREESGPGSPLFPLFHVVIRTTIWDAILHKYTDLQSPLLCSPPLLVLSFWYLSAEVGGREGYNSPHWFVKESLYSHFLSSCTLTASDFHSEASEHNHIWLAVWIAGAGWRSVLSPTLLSRCYIWYFICIQTTHAALASV